MDLSCDKKTPSEFRGCFLFCVATGDGFLHNALGTGVAGFKFQVSGSRQLRLAVGYIRLANEIDG